MNDIKWSEAEKKIARRAFDLALSRECAAIMERLKELAAKAETPKEMWAIQEYLTEMRDAIDQKYDYRYSKLIFVFAGLKNEKWIEDADLAGLRDEKLQSIRSIASIYE